MALKHADLIAKLTLEEKCSLLSGMNFWETQDLPSIKLPSAFLSDGPSGLRKQGEAADHLGLNPSIPATCMPSAATLANSWNPELSYLAGKTIGAEAKEAEVSMLLGPGVNIKRNPRCGRNFEYYSEDPYLAGKMASGYIKGLQENGISACIKHFAGNNQEVRRMTSDSIIDERALREIYLTAFEIAIKESKPKALMTSYNRLNGVYANENHHLLRDILRDEWGFDGVVVSDWGGDNDRVEALRESSDLEMPTSNGETCIEVCEAVKAGRIEESYVDESVDRLLEFILEARKSIDAREKGFDKEAHHEIAGQIAYETVLLLKNKDNVLPLKPKTKVAVVGDFAKKARYQGAGSSIVNPFHVDEPLDLIKSYDLDIVGYAQGFKRYGQKDQKLADRACDLAEKADVVLLFCGLDEVTETEGMDRANIRLPGNQRALISALYHVGKPIVLILQCGSAIEMPFVDRVQAIVHCYLGGEAGTKAMLDTLVGKNNPSAKLSESLPYGYTDCPSADHFGKNDKTIEYRESIFVGYRYYGGSGMAARFPFGFGLSYSKFEYSDLVISKTGVKFKLKNVSDVKGKEVAQLYIGKRNSFIPRPHHELKGFAKVELEPGETKEVEIPFDEYSFRYFNVKTNQFEIEPGEYRIYVGSSSEDRPLRGNITLEGTQAPCPYDTKKIPLMMKGKVREVPDGEFEEILGHEIPEKGIVFIKKKRILVDYNTAVHDLRYSRGWLGRLFARLIGFAIKFLWKIGKRQTSITLVMGVYYIPIRALSRMSGGMITMKQVDGLIEAFNGHFFKGMHHFFKAGRAAKKAAKQRKKNAAAK